jgi:hypothetical protein
VLRSLAVAILAWGIASLEAFADAVTDWNLAFEKSLAAPAERGPRVPVRTLAIMHAAMFDAVNGIEQKYEPLHVTLAAPPGARVEAAAIQAAYTTLSVLRPGSQARWDAQLQVSLAGVPGTGGNSQSIARGREWGMTVANAIIAWRATDNSVPNPPLPAFVGSTAAGYWRHAPLGASATAGYANLVTVPFLIAKPAAFDPGPPYGQVDRAVALTTAGYAADVNDSKARGGATSAVRTAEQLDAALFNDACDIASHNGLLRSLGHQNARLVDNARAFALLNMTAFDTGIIFFRAKYNHALWRPFQAINFADADNNPATVQDAAWTSYLATPPHPEYPSAHVTLFTSMLRVIERLRGDPGNHSLTTAPSAFHPGGTRTYASLTTISNVTAQSRVYIGYHFLETSLVSQVIGREIGDHVVDGFLRPVNGR